MQRPMQPQTVGQQRRGRNLMQQFQNTGLVQQGAGTNEHQVARTAPSEASPTNGKENSLANGIPFVLSHKRFRPQLICSFLISYSCRSQVQVGLHLPTMVAMVVALSRTPVLLWTWSQLTVSFN